MRIAKTIFLASFVLLLAPTTSISQQNESATGFDEPPEYKKLYLHIDREYYFQGDSVWFKAYYLDGQNHQFVSGYNNMYVDLVDNKARTISKQVLPIDNGVAIGNLRIPDSTESGNYLLRAFTDFQKSIGEESFFYKTLKVSNITSSVEQTEVNSTNEQPEIDVAFLPEGGFLLAGQINVLGIKAIDETGKGISVQGRILDGAGEVVSIFATKYKGMDTIHFKPQEEKTYMVEIEGYPEFNYEFRDIKKEGIKLEFVSESRYELLFRGTTNSKRFQGKNYFFVTMHRGREIFQQGFVQSEKDIPIKVNRSLLPGGINRFVLLDEQLQPMSERLLFLKNDEFHCVNISLDRDNYETRSDVQMEIFDELEMNSEAFSSLSVAVVDEKSIAENGPAMNIHSWLLIDSELKGNIESPSDYFIDDAAMSSVDKLNLLMLTHGWSRYIWNAIPEKDRSPDFKETEGFSINGSVTRNYFKNPIVNGKVSLTIFNNEYLFTNETRTDINGMFSFDKIYFTDTASVFIQAWNEKGKLFKTVNINPLFKDSPYVSKTYLPTIKTFSNIPVELQNQKYFNELSIRDYILNSGSILLEEVTVIAEKKKTGDGYYRMYSKPASSLKVTPPDYSYQDVFDYLQGRVAGLVISGETISIRGGGSTHGSNAILFLWNGFPVSKETIENIPMCDIDVVEVVKSIGETAIFGIRGANGVISVFTKMGIHEEDFNTYSPGTISEKICGYSAYRDFYSPAYSPENIDTDKPDHRITLYWNPNIIAENGKASVSFFTSDDISRYKVFVEGITNTGEICLGTSEFEVSQKKIVQLKESNPNTF